MSSKLMYTLTANGWRFIASIVLFGYVLMVSAPAMPATLTAPSTAVGWYMVNGNGSSGNTFTGVSNGSEARSYYVFTLPALGSGEQIVSATFRWFWVSSHNIVSVLNSPQGTETFALRSYEGSIANLVALTGGVASFIDLGNGNDYGERTYSGSVGVTVFGDSSVALSAAAIADLNSAGAGLFAFGGILTTINGPSPPSESFTLGCCDQVAYELELVTEVVPGGDADGDGVLDGADLCSDTAAGPVDVAGCSDLQVDIDGDGYCNIGAPSTGPSACIGTDNCPTISNPGQEDTNGDGFGDDCIDPSVDIPGKADVDPTAVIGPGSTINKGVEIDEGVVLGENVTVNKNAFVGENTTIGDNVVIGQSVMIGSGVVIGDNVQIGKNVTIEDGVTIGSDTTLEQGVYVCSYNMSSSMLTIGSAVTIGKKRLVDDDVPNGIVWSGTNVAPNPGNCPSGP